MLADLLSESLAADYQESWERERTATPVRVFAVQLHATSCSLRETKEILAYSAFNALTKLFGSGYIGWLTAATTRLRRGRSGLR